MWCLVGRDRGGAQWTSVLNAQPLFDAKSMKKVIALGDHNEQAFVAFAHLQKANGTHVVALGDLLGVGKQKRVDDSVRFATAKVAPQSFVDSLPNVEVTVQNEN